MEKQSLHEKYKTEEQLRKEIAESAELRKEVHGREPPPHVFERYVEQRLAEAREAGRLVTSRQWEDLKSERVLREGDRVVFVGETRVEETARGIHHRQNGQTGTIVSVLKAPQGVLVTFQPDRPDTSRDRETVIVRLEVLAYTRGYFDLERLV